MASEIVEDDAKAPYVIDQEAQKESIRKIIQRQKFQYLSSSSSSSFSSAVVSSSSSVSLSHRNAKLLQLMKVGSTSLRRLFEMEHISLSAHFNHYSGSPVTKPILLWGSDSDEGTYDPWEFFMKNVAHTELYFSSPYNGKSKNAEISSTHSSKPAGFNFQETKIRRRKLKLERTKSFRRLPKLSWCTWRGFRFRLQLRRLRIMICGRKV